MKVVAIIISILVGILLGIAFYNSAASVSLNNKNEKKVSEYYEKTYLRLSGGTSLYNNSIINYDLRSWDAGKNWYVVDYNFDTKELKILGEVEKVYPGLMKHLKTMDDLTKHVKENGPIDINNVEDVKILEKSGFKVVTQ